MALTTNKLSVEQSITSSLGSVEPKIEPAAEKQQADASSSPALLKDLAQAKVPNPDPAINNELHLENKETPAFENQTFKTIQKV